MIKIQNLSKSFKQKGIFSNFNLEIASGDFICIYGKSGSGKSTLLNMIGSIEDYDSGLIEFEEKYQCKKDYRYIRAQLVSFVFQNFALLNEKTVLENLLFAMKEIKVSKKEKINLIEQELTKIKMLDFKDRYVYELSGGEMQRIALVRALVKPCKVVLADEPTGSLDYENKQIVIKELLRISKFKTIIIVTHDDEFRKYANKIIEL